METLSHVTRLHKIVLSWDYFQLFERNQDEECSAAGLELPEVAQTYSSPEVGGQARTLEPCCVLVLATAASLDGPLRAPPAEAHS